MNSPSYAKGTARDRSTQTLRLRKLEGERKKLVEAHYADAIPLDLLDRERDRLTPEIASAEGRLSEVESDFQKAATNLELALV